MQNEKILLIAAALVFAALFLFFYPNFYHYPDEQTYLRNSYLFAIGEYRISNPLYSYGYAFNGSEYVSAYPPLQSAILMPFALANWKLSFLAGLMLHLINFFLVYKILKKIKLPAIYSLLYLFYPSIALLSTTLEAEMVSITCTLLAAYFFLGEKKRDPALSGFFAGLSVLARYTNVLIVAGFLAAIIWKERKKAFPFILGAVPPALLVLLFNFLAYGGLFTTAYSVLGFTEFSLDGMPLKLVYYIALLSAIYPLMFFAMFFAKNKLKNITIISSILFLLLWSSYFFFYPRFRLEDLGIGFDKFLPLVPLMIICYAEILEKFVKKFSLRKHFAKIAAVVVILLIAGSCFAMYKHKEKQDEKFEVFKQIYSQTKEGALIIADEEISSLSTSFKETPFTGMFFTEYFGDRKLANVKGNYKQYITDSDNAYYMKIWMDPIVKVEIVPLKDANIPK